MFADFFYYHRSISSAYAVLKSNRWVYLNDVMRDPPRLCQNFHPSTTSWRFVEERIKKCTSFIRQHYWNVHMFWPWITAETLQNILFCQIQKPPSNCRHFHMEGVRAAVTWGYVCLSQMPLQPLAQGARGWSGICVCGILDFQRLHPRNAPGSETGAILCSYFA